ncbi:MAG: type II toxin-antitoxin system HicA family toxin [Candidatus Curtissbacteria bacterium]|nr:type II toxin-antitoxin system HicA family toxin [Candidatus Curtissbacteria bacterium]
MPKLPKIRPRDLIRIFEKQGYTIDRQKGSHVILYHSSSRKRLTIPLHTKDLPDGTLLAIIKQAGLTKDEFLKIK